MNERFSWRTLASVLLLAGAVATFAGYVGAWVNHRAAGLVISGLDLGEYVKFLVPVRAGQVSVWREGFYLPLVAVSLALSFSAFRSDAASGPGRGWPLRALMLAGASVAALNLLPPAWSPAVLRSPEFRTQVVTMGLCLAAVLVSPLLALLPRLLVRLPLAGLALVAAVVPVRMFFAVLPAIADLYATALGSGWGVWLMVAGLIVLAAGQIVALAPRPAPLQDGGMRAGR